MIVSRRVFLTGVAATFVASPVLAFDLEKPVEAVSVEDPLMASFAEHMEEIKDLHRFGANFDLINKFSSKFFDNLRDKGVIYDYSLMVDDRNNPPEVVDSGKIGWDAFVRRSKSLPYLHLLID